MQRDEIVVVVKRIIADQLSCSEDRITESLFLWDDLDADDLDFVEIAMALEEELSLVNALEFDACFGRNSTVGMVIEEVDQLVNHNYVMMDSLVGK